MKAKEFEAKLVEVEKQGDKAQAAEMMITLRKCASLYNPIMAKQFEMRLFSALSIPTMDLPYLPIQLEPLPQISLAPNLTLAKREFVNHSKLSQSFDCESLILSDCVDCTFSGSISTSVTIRNCRNCVFELKVSQIRIHGCHDCCFVIDSNTNPVVEESSGLVFSPLNKSEGNKWNQVKDFSMRPDSFRLKDK